MSHTGDEPPSSPVWPCEIRVWSWLIQALAMTRPLSVSTGLHRHEVPFEQESDFTITASGNRTDPVRQPLM